MPYPKPLSLPRRRTCARLPTPTVCQTVTVGQRCRRRRGAPAVSCALPVFSPRVVHGSFDLAIRSCLPCVRPAVRRVREVLRGVRRRPRSCPFVTPPLALVGGLGTIFGPVVGAFAILTMQYKLAAVGEWVLVIQGVIFVACVLLFRRGIIGEIAHYLRIKL